jgi:hypothetical protein
VNITDKLGQAATIVRHFDFDHHRMTQSVIVKKASFGCPGRTPVTANFIAKVSGLILSLANRRLKLTKSASSIPAVLSRLSIE